MNELTYRQLWNEIMHYGSFDRMPVVHWSAWRETYQRWYREGFPQNLNEAQELAFFHAEPACYRSMIGVNLEPFPAFEFEVMEETAEYRVYRQSSGVVVRENKGRSSIPQTVDYILKGAEDWPEYKKRLQPDPRRIDVDIDEKIARAETSTNPIGIWTGSLMGYIRNWMGVENMSYLMYDDPDCYADMIHTLSDLICWGLDQVLPRMRVLPEMGFGWEDICGSSGPMVAPSFFVKYVAPSYQKIRNKLEFHGISLYGIDTDGLVEPLTQPLLDAGVNLLFPLEPGKWDATPAAFRKKFGRELRIIGGFNKHALEKDHAAIDAEIERHIPAMKTGGFLLMPDHVITPDTPLANYQYYLEKIRVLRF